ncbi:PEP-CTERM sorting domain-containing protein [Rugamonas rivuli]|uniref:PEP-CTERM sorting domain-containing protein n=1 Tax=Rugamonas rivuli TaxID=2743358 RepID=A0A843SEW9_9BURK|nr:PEP-CTERM sorting domain-containing protein [Rugamonas rivuli]MQA19006.1 PEP-CTERM sorting domain-containing protein [Rugamonas rivuli]
MKKMLKVAATLCVALACSASAGAASITIDFEHLPGADGVLGTADDVPTPNEFLQPLGESYAAIGLHFSQGSLLQAAFYDGDAQNHFISSTSPVATLSVPVYGISIESFSFWNATLTAYDSQGHVLATNTLVNPLSGQEAMRGALSITSAAPIYRFSILPPEQQQILNLDRLVLNTSPVPEPGQFAMLLAGLALTAGYARRRSRSVR